MTAGPAAPSAPGPTSPSEPGRRWPERASLPFDLAVAAVAYLTVTVGLAPWYSERLFDRDAFEGYYDQTAHASLDSMGVELARRLVASGRVRVWFRPHPASGVSRPSMLAAIAEIGAVLREVPGDHLVVADRDLTLPECLAAADVLVSDISSVATDFLATERPIITCDPAGLPAEDFVARLGLLDPHDADSRIPSWLVGALRDLQPSGVSPATKRCIAWRRCVICCW